MDSTQESSPLPSARSREGLWFGALLALALLLRVWGVNAWPLHPDEIHYAFDVVSPSETGSVAAVRDVLCRMAVEERRTAHPMLATALERWLWFIPLRGAVNWSPGFFRGFDILLGTLTLLPVWAMMRRASRRRGLLAAALVATLPLLVWVSRTMYLDAAFTLLFALMLWALAAGLEDARLRWPLLGGVFMGALLATKISAPIALPVLIVGALMSPAPWPRRLSHLALALAAALAVWLLWCGPAAYLSRIVTPTDPRYAHYRDDLWSTFLSFGSWHAPTFLAEGPLTLPLLALLGIAFALTRRAKLDLLLLLGLLCLTPLLLIHLPILSGPHGLAPMVLVLALLASRVADLRPSIAAPLLSVHFALAILSIGLRATSLGATLPRGITDFPARDHLYTAVRPWLFDRAPSRSILIALPWENLPRLATPTLRTAQLAQGAIVWAPRPDVSTLGPEIWPMIDVAVFARGWPLPSDAVPREFERVRRGEDYAVYVRRAGSARLAFTPADLTALASSAEDSEVHLIFAGGIYPLTGHLLWNGSPVPVESGPSTHAPVFHGRRDAFDWGTGVLDLPRALADRGEVSITPPQSEDVFWGY
jgi:hypothetical protein